MEYHYCQSVGIIAAQIEKGIDRRYLAPIVKFRSEDFNLFISTDMGSYSRADKTASVSKPANKSHELLKMTCSGHPIRYRIFINQYHGVELLKCDPQLLSLLAQSSQRWWLQTGQFSGEFTSKFEASHWHCFSISGRKDPEELLFLHKSKCLYSLKVWSVAGILQSTAIAALLPAGTNSELI